LLHKPPSVGELRPGFCPRCGVAARPMGGAIRLHGHGLRDRLVIWIDGTDAKPRRDRIRLQRYRCTECTSVITVLPRDLQKGRRFSLPLICVALALWSKGPMSAEKVREKLGHYVGFEPGWPQLRRWSRAGEFEVLGLSAQAPRARAGQITERLSGRAPPDKRHLPIVETAYHGAAYMRI